MNDSELTKQILDKQTSWNRFENERMPWPKEYFGLNLVRDIQYSSPLGPAVRRFHTRLTTQSSAVRPKSRPDMGMSWE